MSVEGVQHLEFVAMIDNWWLTSKPPSGHHIPSSKHSAWAEQIQILVPALYSTNDLSFLDSNFLTSKMEIVAETG